MDLKKTLTRGALRLLEDPRVRKLAQDPRVWRGVTAAWNVRGEIARNLDEHTRRIAKELGLATPAEIRELKRTIEELQGELRRARAREEAATSAAPRKPAPRAKRKPSTATKTTKTTEAGAADAPTDRSPPRRARRPADPGTEPQPD